MNNPNTTAVQARSVRVALAHIVADTRSYHAALRKTAYSTFKIPKSDGAWRTIHAPSDVLKAAHREALACLQAQGLMRWTEADHGFTTGRGIGSMLAALQPGRRIIQADLAKAFHQVTETDIHQWATAHGADSKTARWLARGLTATVEGYKERVLVMGSPLAPAMLLELTHDLRRATERMASVYNGKVTWYADNVVLDVPARHAGAARKALTRLLAGQRWQVKAPPSEDKTVLGWRWEGLNSHPETRKTERGSSVKGQTTRLPPWGWRLRRRLRRRARARVHTWKERAEGAERGGNQDAASRLRQRADALLRYARGQQPRKGCKAAYATC